MNPESQLTPELDAGITIAKVGNRSLARQNLNRLAKEYANNPNYWIWMAWLSESISEMNYALERVLALDPENAAAQAGLQWAKRLSILAQIHTNRNASGLFKNDLPWQSLMTTLGKNKTTAVQPCDEPESDELEGLDRNSVNGKTWEEVQQIEFSSVSDVDPDAETQIINPILRAESRLFEEESEPSEVIELSKKGRELDNQSDVYVEPIEEPEKELIEESIVEMDVFEIRPSRSNSSVERSNSTILILEHSPTIRKLLQITLSQNGYHVVTSANEQEAINAIARYNPKLIVVDTEIPGGDGFRVCKQVKRSPDAAHIELVLLSDREGLLDKLRRRNVGCSEYISKPFKPLALLDSVDRKIGSSVIQAN